MCYYYSIAFLLCPASIRSPRSILLQNYLAIEGRLSIYSRSNPFFRFVFFPFLVPFEHFTVLELSIVQSSQTTHTHHYAFLFHPIFILPLHQNSFANTYQCHKDPLLDPINFFLKLLTVCTPLMAAQVPLLPF